MVVFQAQLLHSLTGGEFSVFFRVTYRLFSFVVPFRVEERECSESLSIIKLDLALKDRLTII